MLRPPPFRYVVLMRVRKHQENVKAQALARVRRRIRQTISEREDLERQQRHTLEEAAATTRSAFDASEVQRHFQYERHLARLAVEKDASLQELRSEEEERRTDLEEAMKHRRVVERLKAHHDERVQAELLKTEQHFADEVATNQAAMKRSRTPL